MAKRYEYKFIRLKHSFWFRSEPENYKEIIRQEAHHGWRLNQILAPSDYHGTPFYELIFEREMES